MTQSMFYVLFDPAWLAATSTSTLPRSRLIARKQELRTKSAQYRHNPGEGSFRVESLGRLFSKAPAFGVFGV